MRSTRLIGSMVAALAILGSACSSSDPVTPGSGGAPGASGGATSTGGGTATGGVQGTGGSHASGGAPATGGSAQPGSGGATSTGGNTVPGTGGKATGGGQGAGTGGATATGGGTAGAGGRSGPGSAGRVGSGGSGAAGGSSGSGAGGAQMSTGCTTTHMLQNGTINITFNGTSRKYILRLPDGYDSSRPYRLVFAFAESGASASSVATGNYFKLATMDKTGTIFAAPDASDGAGTWSNKDVDLTDAILTQLEGDLCVDKSRVFATGFSFGGGMAMALACTRADVFRAVAFFSGADLTHSCPTMLTKPIAYYASQASEDSSGMALTSFTGEVKQAEFAALNGCMADSSSTVFPTSGQPHKCTNYKGCSAGHPTEYCVFNGGHGWEPRDPGQSTSWDAPEAWKFITQF